MERLRTWEAKEVKLPGPLLEPLGVRIHTLPKFPEDMSLSCQQPHESLAGELLEDEVKVNG